MQNAKRKNPTLKTVFCRNGPNSGFVRRVRISHCLRTRLKTEYFKLMQRRSDCKMEAPADSGPDREGGSSRREFIRSLAAISAGLTVAAPLARAVVVTEDGIPKSAPPDKGGVQGLTEINL